MSDEEEIVCTDPLHEQFDFVISVLEMTSNADLCGELIWSVTDDIKGKVHFSLMCSDTFAWGTADAEKVETKEDIQLFAQCQEDLKAISAGAEGYVSELYAARRRGMRPMRLWLKLLLNGSYRDPDPRMPEAIESWKAKYSEEHAKIHELFLTTGPERDPRTEG